MDEKVRVDFDEDMYRQRFDRGMVLLDENPGLVERLLSTVANIKNSESMSEQDIYISVFLDGFVHGVITQEADAKIEAAKTVKVNLN